MAASLEIRDVHQRLGGREVLTGVDLTVPAGRVIGLLGPNGAGKTTLMRILFGVLTPDQGSVRWEGREATATDRRSWGYLPQERGLYRHMRVHDQVRWFGRLHGLDRRTAGERASALLARLGLGDRERDPVSDLSGGMAQRVQLAAAMVHEPPVLVLDEPFAGLDPGAIDFLSDVILDHVGAGRHLLFSSHQLDLVEDLCDEITMIDHGRVVLEGSVRELKAQSPDRFLRVDADVDDSWLDPTVATVAELDRSGSHLRLAPGADALAVLDVVRARTAVTDVAVEAPTLSELFLAASRAVEPHAEEPAFEGAPR